MRVVQVSAHYPPNLVSGGTLVPQRVARGLAARGHHVSVYAGHLDERRPLDTWTEEDGHGVRVRWIATTPWTAWSDPRNSLNPEVTADFEEWLAGECPDVVHLHSLQTLGAGLVSAAHRSGAKVVVTMHDFWWSCARQFLAAPDMRPCSLVVDCGTCPCAVDHAWLQRRNAALHEHLSGADVVLAPSASAARVLAANGVDPSRVVVDENGVPASDLPPVAERAPASADTPVRLMFAGGPDPMKGLPVLLESLAALPASGWTLDLYGVRRDTLPHGARVPGTVRFPPAYDRTTVADVMAAHDVLVLPSVMRESHSIVTREALAAGMAVVCTDTLGPEEVVEDGVNGLVVPAADAESLGAALARLVSEPGLAGRLRDSGKAVAIRDFEDQLDGLESLYADLVGPGGAEEEDVVAGSGAPGGRREQAMSPDGLDPAALDAAEAALLRRVLVVVGIRGAALRYRGFLPAEALRLRGVHVDVLHYRDPQVPVLAADADALVLYRVPATSQIVDMVADVRARPRPVPVLFDIDDLIFDPALEGEVHGLDVLSPEEHALWWRGVARYRTTMELADAYVGSTERLCEHATRTTGLPAFRFANGVGIDLAQQSDLARRRERTPGPLRIGYFSGTNTHDADWAVVEPAVARVLAERPDVELWIGGFLTTGAALEPFEHRIRRLPMLPWYELPGRLRDVDVNLAPLVLENTFNEAKSAIKWLEAALVETPTVASPTQPFRESVDDGRTGFLATTEDAWADAIGALLDDALLRRRVGAAARREALLSWGPHSQADVYLGVLRSAAAVRREHGPRQRTSWEPVVDDEPFDAAEGWIDVHPGIPTDGRAALASRVAGLPGGRYAVAAVRVLRAGGPGALARKVVAKVGGR
ncbi:glycosyltransferase [Cellulomonas triticagri]|uniref:Glycosyltransferase n=1 Tax=Cellulomonas triticagri TaxID=2483352 RepID=A0A3M2JJH9_9CELL|nr:glycosyltransferase [Cellulomonas triticagri]RMI13264.1 glycosyltransferase [Cellulomonas triticagri]